MCLGPTLLLCCIPEDVGVFAACMFKTAVLVVHLLPLLAGDAEGHGTQQEDCRGGAAEDVRGERRAGRACLEWHTEHADLSYMTT